MAEYKYHKDKKKKNYKKLIGLSLSIIGIIIFLYIFLPLISWHIYFAPAIASTSYDSPLPASSNYSTTSITSLIDSAAENLGRDYTNAANWYPGFSNKNNKITYNISIPKIGVENAIVTNDNADLKKHLVHFSAESSPPLSGNSIIFGHSSLPQLFNPNDYTTIFANAYKLKVGDKIIAKVDNQEYNYEIESVSVVDPDDTSALSQDYSGSYITLITCTPPGTIWKRLIIKSRLTE